MAYTKRDIYDTSRFENTWGKTTQSNSGPIKEAFFKDIKIYGFSRGNYVLYTLVNPMISSWTHDTYDYTQANGTMTHTMEVKYEAVKYGRGKIGPEVLGFMDQARYDLTKSSLSQPGSSASIFGQGGILDTFEDLSADNLVGSALSIGRQIKSFKDSNASVKEILTSDVLNQAKKQLPGVLNNLKKQAGSVFPKGKQEQNSTDLKVSTQAKPHPYYVR